MSVALLERARSRAAETDHDVEPRISERRRKVAGERRRGRLRAVRWILVAATVGGVAWVAAHSALLDVDRVVVRGADRTGAEEAMAAGGIRIGDLLVGLDADAVDARLSSLPWVSSASVERSWNGTVTLVLSERTPLAIVSPEGTTGSAVVVDADLRVLAPADARFDLATVHAATTPVGTTLDPAIRPAVVVAGTLTPGLRSRVENVRIGTDGGVELLLRPAGTVRFGAAERVAQKIRSLQTVFAQVDLRCLATVDVRVPDDPVLTRVPTCA